MSSQWVNVLIASSTKMFIITVFESDVGVWLLDSKWQRAPRMDHTLREEVWSQCKFTGTLQEPKSWSGNMSVIWHHRKAWRVECLCQQKDWRMYLHSHCLFLSVTWMFGAYLPWHDDLEEIASWGLRVSPLTILITQTLPLKLYVKHVRVSQYFAVAMLTMLEYSICDEDVHTACRS